jgi:hypothetical protein
MEGTEPKVGVLVTVLEFATRAGLPEDLKVLAEAALGELRARADMADRRRVKSWADAVRAHEVWMKMGEDRTLEGLAARLGVSVRTARRRLQFAKTLGNT